MYGTAGEEDEADEEGGGGLTIGERGGLTILECGRQMTQRSLDDLLMVLDSEETSFCSKGSRTSRTDSSSEGKI